MKTMNRFGAVLAVFAALALGGCESMGDPFGSGDAGPGSISAGSAYAGNGVVNSIDRLQKQLFRFTIRMNDGRTQTLTHETRAGFRVGDRVRIAGGQMQHN